MAEKLSDFQKAALDFLIEAKKADDSFITTVQGDATQQTANCQMFATIALADSAVGAVGEANQVGCTPWHGQVAVATAVTAVTQIAQQLNVAQAAHTVPAIVAEAGAGGQTTTTTTAPTGSAKGFTLEALLHARHSSR
jgi:hypothetical protein